MVMIIGSHFCLFGLQLRLRPMSANKVLLETLFLTQGRVGAILFFIITAYFLCVSDLPVHKSFKKAWILERTLLFWSLLLTLISFLVGLLPSQESLKDRIKFIVSAFLPTTSNCWWFATSYMGFLIIAPFLIAGLKALSQRWHFVLCVIALFAGLSTQLPIFKNSNSVISFSPGIINLDFIAIFTIVAYIRWYVPWLLQKRTLGIICCTIGYLWSLVHVFTKRGEEPTTFNPSVLFEVVGWFIVFYNFHFSSKAINGLASHVFSIYLITEFSTLRGPIWNYFTLISDKIYSTVWMVPYTIGIVIGVCVLCVILDIVKSCIFSLTVDRKKGRVFEFLWSKTNNVITRVFRI